MRRPKPTPAPAANDYPAGRPVDAKNAVLASNAVHREDGGRRFRFTGRTNTSIAAEFAKHVAGELDVARITLDFREVTAAFPDSMILIASSCSSLRSHGIETCVELPQEPSLARLFDQTNWAHYIDPTNFKHHDRAHERHISMRSFRSSEEQSRVAAETIEILLELTSLRHEQYVAIDWALQEVTDNVLCHSDAREGGLIQVATTAEVVHVVVADRGRGILEVMREEFPTLATDAEAIELAVKQGVTSKPTSNQGNGLAGSLAVARASGGNFSVFSGDVACWWKPDSTGRSPLPARFEGTLIDLKISRNPFDVAETLALGGERFVNDGHLELKYWDPSQGGYRVRIARQPMGYKSREAGEALRNKCLTMLQAGDGSDLILDWEGVNVPSSSFADELVAKLRQEMGIDAFERRVRLTNLKPDAGKLILAAIARRWSE